MLDSVESLIFYALLKSCLSVPRPGIVSLVPKAAYDVNPGAAQCSASVIYLHLSGIIEHKNDHFNSMSTKSFVSKLYILHVSESSEINFIPEVEIEQASRKCIYIPQQEPITRSLHAYYILESTLSRFILFLELFSREIILFPLTADVPPLRPKKKKNGGQMGESTLGSFVRFPLQFYVRSYSYNRGKLVVS